MQTVKRNNGDRLVTVNHDGAHLFLIVRAADGSDGRDVPLLLHRDEASRLVWALDQEIVGLDAACKG